MAKYTITRATVALLVLCIASVAFAKFPTSSTQPIQSWTEIHKDGYKGSDSEACELIGLTKVECGQFHTMRENGQCEKQRIPNGAVIDSMAFTRNGEEHTVMHNLLVELKNPGDADADVCQIGNKAVIFPRFCKNLAVVNNWQPKTVKPVKATISKASSSESRPLFDEPTLITREKGDCPAPKTVLIRVYEEKALRVKTEDGDVAYFAALQRIVDGEGLESVRKGPDQSVSALFGEAFAFLKQEGELGLDRSVRILSVVVKSSEGEKEIFNGEITGAKLISLPRWVESSDVINIRFINTGTHGEDGYFNIGMISPSQTGLYVDASDIVTCRTMVLSAIAGDYSAVAVELDILRYPEELVEAAAGSDS